MISEHTEFISASLGDANTNQWLCNL